MISIIRILICHKFTLKAHLIITVLKWVINLNLPHISQKLHKNVFHLKFDHIDTKIFHRTCRSMPSSCVSLLSLQTSFNSWAKKKCEHCMCIFWREWNFIRKKRHDSQEPTIRVTISCKMFSLLQAVWINPRRRKRRKELSRTVKEGKWTKLLYMCVLCCVLVRSMKIGRKKRKYIKLKEGEEEKIHLCVFI